MGWIAILIWLDYCVMPMGSFPIAATLFGVAAQRVFSIVYLVSTVIIICVFKQYIKHLWFSGIICTAVFVLAAAFPLSSIVPFLVIFGAIIFGYMFACFGYAFFMLLNNSEKFYAMLFAVIFSELLTFLSPSITKEYDLLISVLLLVFISVCCIFTRNRASDIALSDSKEIPFETYSVMILVFISYLLNDVTAPAMLKCIIDSTSINIARLYFSGILIGALLTYVIRRVIKMNICHSINISFLCVGLGSFFAVLTEIGSIYVYITAVLFGIAYSIGFITIYYMCGIMSKRFQSVRFYRVGVAVSGVAYIVGFVITNQFPSEVNNTSFIVAAAVCVILSMLIFTVSPLFVKTLYSAEWTDDLYRPDVTYGTRLDEKLNEYALSNREAELCKLLLDGFTLRQIAATLQIAYPTANTYQTGLYRKLGINSKTELLLLFKEHITKQACISTKISRIISSNDTADFYTSL